MNVDLVSALIGAGAVFVTASLNATFALLTRREERKLRMGELASGFLVPYSTARTNSLAEIYGLTHRILLTNKILESDLDTLDAHAIYVSESLLQDLVKVLSKVISSGPNSDGTSLSIEIVTEIKNLQTRIRKTAGYDYVESVLQEVREH